MVCFREASGPDLLRLSVSRCDPKQTRPSASVRKQFRESAKLLDDLLDRLVMRAGRYNVFYPIDGSYGVARNPIVAGARATAPIE